MSACRSPANAAPSAVQVYLLGEVDFEACLALQQRLVYETSGRTDGQITLLICEHPETITVGRGGSRAHLHWAEDELTSRRVRVHWINRGGGCLAHVPGQLAIYPIVPLDYFGWTVGSYLARLESGLLATLAESGVEGQTREGWPGVWGRTGQLAAVGVAVKNWTTYHGAFLNVAPAMRLFRRIDTDPAFRTPMSSLVVESQKAIKMTLVRAEVVRHLATALEADRYHVHTGHPLLNAAANRTRESPLRAH